MATFGALDEFRHTQIPLLLFHQLVKFDSQFDWAHKFYHTNNWFAIAARHFFDELTLGQNAIGLHRGSGCARNILSIGTTLTTLKPFGSKSASVGER